MLTSIKYMINIFCTSSFFPGATSLIILQNSDELSFNLSVTIFVMTVNYFITVAVLWSSHGMLADAEAQLSPDALPSSSVCLSEGAQVGRCAAGHLVSAPASSMHN